MSKLTCALAIAVSALSMVTGTVLLASQALAAEAPHAPAPTAPAAAGAASEVTPAETFAAAAAAQLQQKAPVEMYQSAVQAQVAQTLSPEQARLEARAELQQRLEALVGFSARFKQELTNAAGNLLMEGSGELFLLRPDHFLLHSQTPDELAFFTRGSDLYYYDAAVNQLTITSMESLSANPLMLLADVNSVSWDDYEVMRDGEIYTLVPQEAQDVKNLTLAFSPDYNGDLYLSALTIRMDDGNTNFYLFTKQSFKVDPSIFDFPLPDDVEVDDLR